MNEHVSLFSPQTLVDPFDYYRLAHEAGTKIEHMPAMNTHVLYSYDLCSEATARPQEFSNDFGSLMGAADPEIDAILATGWDIGRGIAQLPHKTAYSHVYGAPGLSGAAILQR